MSADKDLIKACAALSGQAPEAWKNFLVTFRGYSEETKNRLVSSPKDVIYNAQGRAQQCQTLVELFSTAVKTADRIR